MTEQRRRALWRLWLVVDGGRPDRAAVRHAEHATRGRVALSSTYSRPVLDWHKLPQDEADGPYSWKPPPPTIGPRKPRARAGRR